MAAILIGKAKQNRIKAFFASTVAVFALAAIGAAGDPALAQEPGPATVAIAGNHPLEAAALAGGPEIAPAQPLQMEIILALQNAPGLKQLLAAQQDPSSPQYHQWLSAAEFNARFGPTPAQVSAVSSWVTSQGFALQSADASLRRVVFTAAASSAESAFAVKIHTDPTGTRFANLSDPVVPKSLAPVIAEIRGLSNLGHAQPTIEVSPDFAPVPAVKLGKFTHFGPNDLYTFYDQTPPTSSSNDGTGTDCIAVIEDSDVDSSSVPAFDQQFGLPPVNLVKVFADGTNPGINSSESEALLDIEYAHAAAPGVPIYAYIGDSISGVFDAAARAVSDNTCGAISISFALCGEPSSFYTGTIDPLAQEAAAHGQSIFVAAGDWGAAGLALNAQGSACVPGNTRNVSEVSADPYITAVGGTQFKPHYKSGNDVGSVRESVWHDKTGAGGGGESQVFAKPTYQNGLIPSDTNRDVPDVALVASPVSPGFFFGYNGAIYCCIGGTSLSSPYWAGVAQLAAQKANLKRLGSLNPTLYSIANGGSVRDVTKGNNGFHHVPGFKATQGYDKASGLGTPDIDLITSAIAAH